MTDHAEESRFDPVDHVHAAAGFADLVLDRVGEALQQAGGVLRRGDRAALLRDGYGDLVARGRLTMLRHGRPAESGIELAARQVEARRAATA